jgi:signal transduction histidine kinase
VIEYSRQLEQKSRELERASADLKAANERLTELDRMKDDFLSTVTHELRTPLTSIRSFSEILHDSPELDLTERQHFLTIIIRESERLTRLINQVLDLSKMESGRMKWQMADIDLTDVIDHAVAALRHLFEEKQVALEVFKPENVPTIRGDRDQLIQLAINLLSNAEKFCPPVTGRVAVEVKNGTGELVVSVADNGPGIPYAEQEKIFEKFHQVRSGQTGNPMGSGLGLAICRGIVEHLGGRLWVESTPGAGATFFFAIPSARQNQAAAAAGE